MRIVPSLLIVACVAAACSKEAPKQADTAAAVDTTPPDTTPKWVSKTWLPGQHPTFDRGTGVIGFAAQRKGAPPQRIDTLTLRAEPLPDAEVSGYFMTRFDTTGTGWRWGLKAPNLDKPNLMEFDNEMAGVPTDSASADRRWVRALLGTDDDGNLISGWVDTRTPGVVRRAWATYFTKMPIFVIDTTTGAIAPAPDSTTQQLPPDDYQLYGTGAVRGRWLQVRVVSPSDRCTTDKSPRTQTLGWVQYLDVKGRPRFWYYMRGC